MSGPPSRRWRARLLALSLTILLAWVAAAALDFGPRPLGLGLLVTVVVTASWLAVDSLGVEPAVWKEPPTPVPPSRGTDRRLAAYARLIEDQLNAATPDPALRDRLVGLARSRDPDLGDEELRRLAGGPVRRMSLTEIDALVERIEQT